MSQDQEYDNTNRGVLFKNNKEGNDKRPDYTGSLDVGGVEYQISAWIRDYTDRETGNPRKLLSLSVSDKKDWVNKDTREKLSPKQDKPKDDVIVEVGDEPISLDDIPF